MKEAQSSQPHMTVQVHPLDDLRVVQYVVKL